ncbi:MAG: metallophosphoesterase [Candidatus Thiodiazotropha sp.]
MEVITVFHISDLHFGSESSIRNIRDAFFDEGCTNGQNYRFGKNLRTSFWKLTSHNQDVANSLAETLNIAAPKVDALVVSGDISTDGSEESLSSGAFFLGCSDQKPGKGFECQINPPLSSRTLVVPGNHDRYRYPTPAPGGNKFDEIFYKNNKWPLGGFVHVTNIIKGDETIAFIAVDFTLPRDYMPNIRRTLEQGLIDDVIDVFGRGIVAEPTLNSLLDETDKAREKGQAVIWVTHFSPLLDCVDSKLKLINTEKLLRAANDSSIPFILSGHTHKNINCNFNGTISLTLGSSTSVCAIDNNKFSLYSFCVDSGEIVDFSGEMYSHINSESGDNPHWVIENRITISSLNCNCRSVVKD